MLFLKWSLLFNVAEFVLPKQRGVELDQRVQLFFFQQVMPDFLDLVGWTAVHGAERDIVGNAIGNLNISQARV